MENPAEQTQPGSRSMPAFCHTTTAVALQKFHYSDEVPLADHRWRITVKDKSTHSDGSGPPCVGVYVIYNTSESDPELHTAYTIILVNQNPVRPNAMPMGLHSFIVGKNKTCVRQTRVRIRSGMGMAHPCDHRGRLQPRCPCVRKFSMNFGFLKVAFEMMH